MRDVVPGSSKRLARETFRHLGLALLRHGWPGLVSVPPGTPAWATPPKPLRRRPA
ncbi:MAG: hypothetical protein ACRDQU_21120 [Pseudonocardiaceae bacterium]